MNISDADRELLVSWVCAAATPQRVARRARIVLLAADGHSAREITWRLGVSTHTVGLWKRRFQAGGPSVLHHDAPGRGRRPTVTLEASARLRTLLAAAPPVGRWTVRALANATGISRASVHRALKPGNLTLAND